MWVLFDKFWGESAVRRCLLSQHGKPYSFYRCYSINAVRETINRKQIKIKELLEHSPTWCNLNSDHDDTISDNLLWALLELRALVTLNCIHTTGTLMSIVAYTRFSSKELIISFFSFLFLLQETKVASLYVSILAINVKGENGRMSTTRGLWQFEWRQMIGR